MENTTTETTVFEADITENTMRKGRLFKLQLTGDFSTVSSSEFFTMKVYIGGTEVMSVSSTAANVSGAAHFMETFWTVRDHGTSGKIMIHSNTIFDDEIKNIHHGLETIDTTITKTVKVTVTWDNADPGNIFDAHQGHITRR